MEKETSTRIKFSDLFEDDDIFCHTSITDRDKLLMEMLKHLAFKEGIGNVEDALDAVVEREDAQSTSTGHGIAMPHARLSSVDRPLLCLATSEQGIAFTPGEPPIKLVIMILIPRDQPATYLQILSALGRCCADKGTAQTVSRMESKENVFRFFQRDGMALPDHICAGDIMVKTPVALRESDSLKDAIDLFVAENLTNVPVIDKGEDLVGVVTAHALMRVCLPDYILWMDDLSPIMNFEPFTNVLRHERNTWLAEIMTQDFASVQVDAPAMKVAEEITKNQTGQCYVTHNEKLVGVITLQHFLNKVLRE